MVLLVAGVLIPILAAIMRRTGNAFERSGSLTVFCAGVAEFVTINRLTEKHIRNASRALNGKNLGMSLVRRNMSELPLSWWVLSAL